MSRVSDLLKKETLTDVERKELTTLIEANEAIVKDATKIKDENATLKLKADQLDEALKNVGDKDAQLFKIKLESRMQVVSKYLGTKNNDAGLVKKIGDMADDDFDLFKDGKTNDVFQSADDLKIKIDALAVEKTEFDTAKDKIIADALKNAKKAKDADDDDDEPLLPEGELGNKKTSKDKDEEEEDGSFPNMDKLKEMFRLDSNPIYHNVKGYENKTKSYLDNYGDYDDN